MFKTDSRDVRKPSQNTFSIIIYSKAKPFRVALFITQSQATDAECSSAGSFLAGKFHPLRCWQYEAWTLMLCYEFVDVRSQCENTPNGAARRCRPGARSNSLHLLVVDLFSHPCHLPMQNDRGQPWFATVAACGQRFVEPNTAEGGEKTAIPRRVGWCWGRFWYMFCYMFWYV